MSKTRWVAFFSVALLFFIENTFTSIFGKMIIYWLLCGIIFYALAEGAFFGLCIGIYAGLWLDLIGAGRFGTQMLGMGLAGLLYGFTASKIFRDNPLIQLILPFLGILFLVSFEYLIRTVFQKQEIGFWDYAKTALNLQSIVLTTICTPFLFNLLRKVSFVKPERNPWA